MNMSSGYKLFFNNNWISNFNYFNKDSNSDNLIRKNIDMYYKSKNDNKSIDLWIAPRVKPSVNHHDTIFNKEYIGIYWDFELHEKKYSKMIRDYTSTKSRIKYLNIPTFGIPLNNYFDPSLFSKLKILKEIEDPNNMFITRFNLHNQD